MKTKLEKGFAVTDSINRMSKSRPYVDPVLGVMWGTDSGDKKEKSKKHGNISKV